MPWPPEDAEGCKDHPLFNRFPNMYLGGCESSQFDLRKFPVGQMKPGKETLDSVDVEGRGVVGVVEDDVGVAQLVQVGEAAVHDAGEEARLLGFGERALVPAGARVLARQGPLEAGLAGRGDLAPPDAGLAGFVHGPVDVGADVVGDRLPAAGIGLEPAVALDLSEHTVNIHVKNILSKLGVQSRTQAVLAAIRLGIVCPQS